MYQIAPCAVKVTAINQTADNAIPVDQDALFWGVVASNAGGGAQVITITDAAANVILSMTIPLGDSKPVMFTNPVSVVGLKVTTGANVSAYSFVSNLGSTGVHDDIV